MKSILSIVAVLSALAGGAVVFTLQAHAQSGFVQPDKLRFRLVGDEPVASPDGRNTLANWKVVVLKDMQSGQCHIAFLSGAAMSVTESGVCP